MNVMAPTKKNAVPVPLWNLLIISRSYDPMALTALPLYRFTRSTVLRAPLMSVPRCRGKVAALMALSPLPAPDTPDFNQGATAIPSFKAESRTRASRLRSVKPGTADLATSSDAR
jgi:hypothetical protein